MFTSLRKYDDPAKFSGRYRRSERGNERKLDNYCYYCLFLGGFTVDMYKYEINIFPICVIYLKICVNMSHTYKHFSFIDNFWISISNVFHFFKDSEFTYINLDPEQCMRCSNFGKKFWNFIIRFKLNSQKCPLLWTCCINL